MSNNGYKAPSLADGHAMPNGKTPKGSGASPLQAGFGFARRFPLDTLPQQMQAYVVDLAERKQVPVDLPALTLLGAIGSLAGPRMLIRRDLDWVEPTNIYTAVGMGSGGAKSPVVNEIRNGMLKARKKLTEKHETKLATRLSEMKAEVEFLRMTANEATTTFEEKETLRYQANKLERDAEELERNPPPPPEMFLDGDTGCEALAETMAVNAGCGPVIDDEGALIRNIGGQYLGKTGNIQLLLVGYECRYYRPARVTRKATPIERAAVSIVISPQPGLIASMIRNPILVELGLVNRFFICLPGDLIGLRNGRPSIYYQDVPEERPDNRGRRWWSELVERLVGFDILDGSEEKPLELNLTRAAHKRHYEYGEALERRCHPATGDLRKAAPWVTKHAARVLRLSALLHLAAGFTPDRLVDESMMENAIAIGDWAIEHYLNAANVVGLSEEAGRIKEFIDGTELGRATRTAVVKGVFSNRIAAEVMDSCIAELVASGGYEAVRLVGESGGRAVTTVRRCDAAN